MTNYAKIDRVLEKLALCNTQRINPYQVANIAEEQNVDLIYQYMKSKVPYILIMSYEILCPNQDSTLIVYDLKNIPDEWLECRICGVEFFPSKDDIHIVFSFNQEYVANLQQEKKILRQLIYL